MKRQEFVADFSLAARRALNEKDYQLFRYAFVLGADHRLCCRCLGIERTQYFYDIYRIEETLGKYLAELEPYPLYPVDEYMGGSVRAALVPRMPMASEVAPRRRRRDRLPMTA
jgi:hypothetical protein